MSIQERIDQRVENIALAKDVGFKPVHPTLYHGKTGKLRVLSGYDTRVNNWLKCLNDLIDTPVKVETEDWLVETEFIHQTR